MFYILWWPLPQPAHLRLRSCRRLPGATLSMRPQLSGLHFPWTPEIITVKVRTRASHRQSAFRSRFWNLIFCHAILKRRQITLQVDTFDVEFVTSSRGGAAESEASASCAFSFSSVGAPQALQLEELLLFWPLQASALLSNCALGSAGLRRNSLLRPMEP